MDEHTTGSEGTPKGEQNALPVSKTEPNQMPIIPIEPTVPPSLGQDVPSGFDENSSNNYKPNADDPLFVRVIKDDDLSSFETKSARYAKYGIGIAAISLAATIGAGIVFFFQFQEMTSQTSLLGIAAVQARRDANESSKAASRQLIALQKQITAAQTSTKAIQGQLEESKKATGIAATELNLSNRPWVKISVSISQPLTFNEPRNAGLVATMTTDNVIENIGQSVALNVLSWEDVIAVDADGTLRTALARQKQWCGAHRHLQKGEMSGNVLFPHSPSIETMVMGPTMTKVNEAALANKLLPGKVAFVLVGCVSYRSSFESADSPGHQTRFVYQLGVPTEWGGFQPNIDPSGVATQLHLIQMPNWFTAD